VKFSAETVMVTCTHKLIKLATLLGLLVVAAGVSAGQARAEKYALLVGVRHYQDSRDLKTLTYTEADMIGLARALRTTGFRQENVVLMTDTSGVRFRPESARIRLELQQLLKRCTPADTLLVAFSGHGIQLRSTGEFFFCPADTDLTNLKTLVSLTDLYKQLERCPAGLKLLLADACRTDPFKAAKSRAISDVESVTRPQKVPPPGGVAAFFACSQGQEAYEDDNLKNGVFFHYVIEGLLGKAASPGTKEVTLAGLQDYVTRRVTAYVRANFRKEQEPELVNKTRGLVTLVGGPAEERRTPSAAQQAAAQTVALRPSAGDAAAASPRQELRDLLARARAFARRGDADRALTCWDQALKLDASSAEAHAGRADALNGRGEHDAALTECEQALRLNGTLALAYEYRADAFLGKHEYQEAARACAEALKLDQNLAGVHNDLGILFLEKGKFDEAVAELTKALQLDPGDAAVYGNRAVVYLKMGEYAKAVSDCTESLRLGARRPSTYSLRAQAQERLGHTDLARSDRQQAAQLAAKPAQQ
jgi:tetratricopeptide (TPR) repeat protein